MKITAVDPGLMSGVAFFDSETERFESSDQSTWDALRAVDVSILIEGLDLVVCESFVPRPGVRTWQPQALESIGALRFLCMQSRVDFELQSPAEAKSFSSNEKLKKIGWYRTTPGGHANDAARHLLVAAVRHNILDPSVFLGTDG